MTSAPTVLAITMATYPGGYTPGGDWTTADEVRHRLRLLGFDCTSQFVAARMARMARVDAPWLEVRESVWGGPKEYRVSSFGECDIQNRFPGLWRAHDASLTRIRKAMTT